MSLKVSARQTSKFLQETKAAAETTPYSCLIYSDLDFWTSVSQQPPENDQALILEYMSIFDERVNVNLK